MKVVYIIPWVKMSGDNQAILKIIPHLINDGVEPLFIITSQIEGSFVEVLSKNNYRFYCIPAYKYNIWPNVNIKEILKRIKNYVYGIFYYKKVKQLVKEFNPDIIHTNCCVSSLGYKLSKDLNVPHLWHLREFMDIGANHNYFPSVNSFLEKINSKKNFSVCVSKEIYEYYQSSPKGSYIYDGIFDETKSPMISIKEKKFILFVGKLIESKGIEQVIRVFTKFSRLNNNYILRIVGSGSSEYQKKLRSMIQGLENRVEFLGQRNDVYDLMQNAYCIIVASKFEGFGFVTAEAMYNGCLVIGHDTAGTKMQFDNGLEFSGEEVGLRYNNDQDLLDCLIKVNGLDSNVILSKLKLAQNTVCHFYSASNSAKKVYEKYLYMLNYKE